MSEECQFEACAIQTCLAKNNYQEGKCKDVVKRLYLCCAGMYDKSASDEVKKKSTACPKEEIVRKWLATAGH